MLVVKMAGKRFQADLPGAPLRRFHSSTMIFFLNLSGHSRDGGLDPLAVPKQTLFQSGGHLQDQVSHHWQG